MDDIRPDLCKNALDNEMKNFHHLTGVWKQYFVGMKIF